MRFKLFALFLVLSFFNSHVIAQENDDLLSGDALIYEFKKNQVIKFKLADGSRMIIKYVTKTNDVIVGNKVKFDAGNYVTQEEKVIIPYGTIESYEIIFQDTKKEKFTAIGLAAGFILLVILAISVGKALREGATSMK